MKKYIFLSTFIVLLLISFNVQAVVGKEDLNEKDGKLEFSEPTKNKTKALTNFTKEDAIEKAINYHNSSSDYPNFDVRIRPGDIVTKDFMFGVGDTTQLELSVDVRPKNEGFLVTLIQDFNITVNGEYRLSKWTYDVSPNELEIGRVGRC